MPFISQINYAKFLKHRFEIAVKLLIFNLDVTRDNHYYLSIESALNQPIQNDPFFGSKTAKVMFLGLKLI
jgi:hypothetical protein